MHKDLLKTIIADQEYYVEQAKGSVNPTLPCQKKIKNFSVYSYL